MRVTKMVPKSAKNGFFWHSSFFSKPISFDSSWGEKNCGKVIFLIWPKLTKLWAFKVPKKCTFEKKIRFFGQYGYQSIRLDELYKNICNTRYLGWVSADLELVKVEKIAEIVLKRAESSQNALYIQELHINRFVSTRSIQKYIIWPTLTHYLQTYKGSKFKIFVKITIPCWKSKGNLIHGHFIYH